MNTQRLAQLSQRMSLLTLLLIVVMLVLNTAVWLYPVLSSSTEGLGFGFALSDRLIQERTAQVALFPWWQILGGIVLSSIPLMALAFGLNHLRQLFRNYARGEYFSSAAAQHLGKVGRAVALWVLLDFLCEPLLSVWVTMNEPVGQRLITLSLTPPSFVALFLAACIAVIARILWQASEVDSENRTFV
ncbi:DUF2975 domain-containing protein [Pseudomonas poae]|jgi:hypothetical protein|uniref:DUF2975 domain-containing protein n=1 Tax=Pseudomonas poae TaxID=200451 RepID=A0A7M1KDD7_9PSED|nr:MULTISPECIES: DUF2975 domain-containing protein [Pseudomonas]NWA82856.1 DUF2975 domain-containing protein [Pseudomonas sp. D2002]QOQ73838.1 DUF2975 domain-containing protein [Pseudomonas poae]